MPRLRKPNAPATTKGEARKVAREDKAFELLTEGKSMAQVAEAIGVQTPTAVEYVHRAMERRKNITGERADLLREVHHERYEGIVRVLWGPAMSGSIEAIRELVKVLAEQAKLWGLALKPPDAETGGMTVIIQNTPPWERGETYEGETVEVPSLEPPPLGDAPARPEEPTPGGEEAQECAEN